MYVSCRYYMEMDLHFFKNIYSIFIHTHTPRKIILVYYPQTPASSAPCRTYTHQQEYIFAQTFYCCLVKLLQTPIWIRRFHPSRTPLTGHPSLETLPKTLFLGRFSRTAFSQFLQTILPTISACISFYSHLETTGTIQLPASLYKTSRYQGC